MILLAQIEEWLSQPESIRDLEEGPCSAISLPYLPDGEPSDAEPVFHTAGQAQDRFFFYAGGRISQLFTRAEIDADPERIRKYGYQVVRIYEKLYATTNETSMHFVSEEAIHRHIRSSGPARRSRKGDIDILLDPKGGPDPKKGHIVSGYRNMKPALDRANRLAAEFGVRLAVAKVIGMVDNH